MREVLLPSLATISQRTIVTIFAKISAGPAWLRRDLKGVLAPPVDVRLLVEVERDAWQPDAVRRRVPSGGRHGSQFRRRRQLPEHGVLSDVEDARRAHRDFDPRREMKMPAQMMDAAAVEAVDNRDRAGRPLDRERALVHDRLGQARVSSMSPAVLHDAVALDDLENLRGRFLEH